MRLTARPRPVGLEGEPEILPGQQGQNRARPEQAREPVQELHVHPRGASLSDGQDQLLEDDAKGGAPRCRTQPDHVRQVVLGSVRLGARHTAAATAAMMLVVSLLPV